MTDALAALAQIDGVPSAIASAGDAVAAVLRDRGLRRISDAHRRECLAAGAQASAGLTLDADRWLFGASRLAAELVPLAAMIRIAPAQALARAHLLTARGVVAEELLGRLDPLAADAAVRVGDLGRLLVRPTGAPAIVLGAVVHAELATVAPFGEASGILARAAERMVLIASGLDPQGVIPVEVGHADLGPAAYRSALDAYGAGTVAGVGAWLRWCAAAVARAAELSPARAS